jgi:hypothetical protein
MRRICLYFYSSAIIHLFKGAAYFTIIISIFSIKKPNGWRVTGWTTLFQLAFYLENQNLTIFSRRINQSG